MCDGDVEHHMLAMLWLYLSLFRANIPAQDELEPLVCFKAEAVKELSYQMGRRGNKVRYM